MRGLVLALAALLPVFAGPALATNYYYVGGPLPAAANDGSWQWRPAGIDAAYDWIQANGGGTDWDIRVHATYVEDVGAASIDLVRDAVIVNRVRGAMLWSTGTTTPENVRQELSTKSTVTGTGDRVFFIRGTDEQHPIAIALDGFTVNGSVRFSSNTAGSVLLNCHVHGLGQGSETREGVHVHDTSNGVYVLNSLIDGFATGLSYLDIVPGRTVFVANSTIAANSVGISNSEAPWTGALQLYNSVIAADHSPVAQTANTRSYACSDVYDGDGSFNFDGVYDINVGGSSVRDNPLLLADFTLGLASPCINRGTTTLGAGFSYIDIDPTEHGGFQPDVDVVVSGTPPADANYVILTDLVGQPRILGGQIDMGAFESSALPPLVPEPQMLITLLLAVPTLLAPRRRRRRLTRETTCLFT